MKTSPSPMSSLRKRFCAIISALALSAVAASQAADVFTSGFLKREFFSGAVRVDVENGVVTTPNSVTAIATFETPTNVADNYTQRVSGFFTPVTTGNYIFVIAADDDADLFLSTDDTPANKQLIAQETGWSPARRYSAGNVEKTSNPVTLTAGRRYYIEAVHHEGGGGDNLAVDIALDTDPTPTDGNAPRTAGGAFGFFAPPATVAITTQPAAATAIEGKAASFSVVATTTGTFGLAYQWQLNSNNIPGATSSTYTTPILSTNDSGSFYTVVVSSAGAPNLTSAAARLTVNRDTVAPRVLSAGSMKTLAGGTEVSAIFDEALDAVSAAIATNYTLSAGAAVTAARHVTNSSGLASLEQGVVLSVTGVNPGTTYTLTVRNVKDAKGNAITTPATINFVATAFGWTSIGRVEPGFTPAALNVASNGFNLVSGGQAFWNADDDITMVYEEITGDFDKIARVEYSDPASNWARSGISVRESLNNGQPTTDINGANPASRYQMVLADPTIRFDGAGANNSYETNRRLNTGVNTTSSNAGGVPAYPNAWLRLRRVGSIISMYRGSDGMSWIPLGQTDFGDPAVSDSPLPDKMFVGPTYGPENGNISGADVKTGWKLWATRIRNYSSIPVKPRGLATWTLGISFGSDEATGVLSSNEVAGVNYVAQGNWNNVPLTSGTAENLVAESNGQRTATTVSVEWSSPNTWASTGPRGENNNLLPGADGTLMTGYLDTGGATTTTAKISNIPAALTATGYDVYVYLLGGVGNRGGAYRVLDGAGNVIGSNVLAQAAVNPTTFIEVTGTNYNLGNYVVFRGLKASTITVEASTADGFGMGGTPRAPINAIQIASPVKPPRAFSLGLNFGADEYPNAPRSGTLASNVVAGVGLLAQQNWNNLSGASGTNVSGVIADVAGFGQAVSTVVSWSSPNTWSTTGRGEENNAFANAGDKTLMTGYLDTGGATTTTVTISNVPPALTASGYDVVVYGQGGVAGRGGSYQIKDAVTKAVLKGYIKTSSPSLPTGFVNATSPPGSTNRVAGNYVIFSGLNAPSIIVEAVTADGQGFSGTPRAPLAAIQLLSPATGAVAPPAPTLSFTRSGSNIIITYTGTLQSADRITGPWTNVSGASPLTVALTGAGKFYRASQ